ncbi:hypothetical protein [Rhodanobacter glycinis]|uniref:hypothetical protein n=1 Tax=Rhodanobacter glycinis TaxID=582702 RepID=UPI0011274EE2|nr:hypothetical protein [Rhodanobacter glycinis]
MINMSPLEKDIIVKILDLHFHTPGLTKHIVESLVVKSRKFSLDVLNKERCAGFYLHFNDNSLLSEFESLPRQVSIHVNHPGLPTGGDFLLFLTSVGGVDFLEASFYGDVLPISEIMSANHAFQIDE